MIDPLRDVLSVYLAGVRSFVPEQQAETRIIGGQEAWAHSWPWQVSLRFASMPACGGAVIGPTWVISAAHLNRLQEVNVTILPSDACNRFYSGRIQNSMFCAGRDTGGVDACQVGHLDRVRQTDKDQTKEPQRDKTGDSGGPLSCFNGGRYELAGLVSWGVGCGRARRPGVYTRVQQHTEWIRDTMSESPTPAAPTPGRTCSEALVLFPPQTIRMKVLKTRPRLKVGLSSETVS
uniref:Transmembrane protease serine 9-like n=1 Tax=Stegastes partitus TaxID=144197 RepID=A0A3B5AP06_9TELE